MTHDTPPRNDADTSSSSTQRSRDDADSSTSKSSSSTHAPRHLILGAMFRALGAYPSGWRQPGAHHDPADDGTIIRQVAKLAEDARLDYLFFGDWLATGHDLEYRDPYLLARIDPVSAITFAAGITERIGLIATANTTYSDPYTLARSTASVDILSGGRAGLNLVTGAEPRAAGNHGRDAHQGNADRYDRAEEFVGALRSLWDSFEDDAFVGDQDGGVLIDPTKLHRSDIVGSTLSVTGPLNAARPPQGHLPIVNAGTSPRSRELVAAHADLALVAVPTLQAGIELRASLRAEAAANGRDPDALKVISPILPVVAETTEEAWAIVDRLLDGIPVDDRVPADTAGSTRAPLPDAFPTNRTIAALAETVGADLAGKRLADVVTDADLAGFSDAGRRLVALVGERTGRVVAPVQGHERPGNDDESAAIDDETTANAPSSPSGHRFVTFRHLLVTSVVPAAIVAGDAVTVADHFERWFRAGAVDGFNVLTAFQPAQFEAFTGLLVPELQRRGLFRTEYSGHTLREHLGLERPENVHVRAAASRAAAAASEAAESPLHTSDDRVPQTVS
ncbi:LLM class flavin-dependent oxidoreductase [Plantibacter sp. YIM 135249]|uniref:LLM class flavin-dependent oxidoreductase n=1 Tax=Plantibacter sp. YIM 135249 TaxID=3423918 RepID=UPI003D358112